MLSIPEITCCWPLGYFTDSDSDNDEECGRGFEGGREDLEDEEDE